MTKINKLGKSTFVIAILSFLLVAVLAFGGTYAYFSASAEKAGSFQLGRLQVLTVDGTGTSGAMTFVETVAQPNQTVSETVTATIDSNINYYVRAIVTVAVQNCTTAENETDHKFAHSHTCGGGDEITTSNLEILDITGIGKNAEGSSVLWENVTGTNRYYLSLVDGKAPIQESTETSQSIIVTIKVQDWVGAKGCNYWMDATITVTVEFETLQADYLEGVTAAGYTTNAALDQAWDGFVNESK